MAVRCMAVLTGGGDCPGLNAVIRAVALTAAAGQGCRVLGIEDGFAGLVEGRCRELTRQEVSGILDRGGTVLGTTNRENPFHYPLREDGKLVYRDLSDRVARNLQQWGVEALVVIGGDGSMNIAHELSEKGVPVVGVPKTIDNDLAATDLTFGFYTAVATATEAVDKLHTTAESHHRVMVLEVMGRYTGWIALASGLAGGADLVLIPELPFTWEAVIRAIEARRRAGKKYSIVVVAEGAAARGEQPVVKRRVEGSEEPVRLGGIGELVGSQVERRTGLETRVTVLGHVQRGGIPSAFDRILATRYGVAAARLALEGRFGQMVSLQGDAVGAVPLAAAVGRLRTVPPQGELVAAARATGVSFGDEG
ncbi:MAG: ATP-dependent 6-phosphofructokinase [Thermaerobacter sp.]|jgi:6-phosphofructokinase 1|nr:ATP-dependent 6-phosphofructokinase [Thermaerobacter sp.]